MLLENTRFSLVDRKSLKIGQLIAYLPTHLPMLVSGKMVLMMMMMMVVSDNDIGVG